MATTKKAKSTTKSKKSVSTATETTDKTAGAAKAPELKIQDERVIQRANEICAAIPVVMQSQSSGDTLVEYKALLLSLQFMLARFVVDFKHDEKDVIDDLRALIAQDKNRYAEKG